MDDMISGSTLWFMEKTDILESLQKIVCKRNKHKNKCGTTVICYLTLTTVEMSWLSNKLLSIRKLLVTLSYQPSVESVLIEEK